MTQRITLLLPGKDYLGGASLYTAAAAQFGADVLLGVIVEKELFKVTLLLSDGADRELILQFVAAHIPISIQPDRGALASLTVDQADAWIDNRIGGASTVADVKAAVIVALKALAHLALTR